MRLLIWEASRMLLAKEGQRPPQQVERVGAKVASGSLSLRRH